MKLIRILIVSLFFAPIASFGASNDFMVAAQLLAAAKNADIQQVQSLVNAGADVNFVDSTGLSIVCTALMNNDVRAAQILQMYGADASKCDTQIKKYNNRTKPRSSGGLFSGLSSAQSISLTAAGAAVVVGGLFLLTDLFDPGNNNDNPSSGGNRPGGDGSGGGAQSGGTVAFTLPYGPACDSKTGQCGDIDFWSPDSDSILALDFDYMKPFNYLMMSYAYNSFARGYMGMDTVRITSDKAPFDLNVLPFAGDVPGGGRPVAVAAITTNGVNATGSLNDGLLEWVDENQIKTAQSQCSQYGSDSTQCQNAMASLIKVSRKFYNRTNTADLTDLTENKNFDFSGHNTVFGDATDLENLNAKVIAGWEAGERTKGDAYGFVPNGQLSVYRTGGGLSVDADVGDVTNADVSEGWQNGDTFTLHGVKYIVQIDEKNGNFTAVNAEDDTNVIKLAKSGNLLNFALDGTNYEAEFNGNVNSLEVIDLKNYDAMLAAASLADAGVVVNSVIANIAQNPQSINSSYLNTKGMERLMSELSTDAAKKSLYATMINNYYNLNTADDNTKNSPGYNADALYLYVGNNQNQIIVNSVGAYEFGIGNGMSVDVLDPTFENYAPALYPNLEHLFVSVVAVQNEKGTSSVDKISDYSSSAGKIILSEWGTGYNNNGTPDNKDDDFYEHLYSSRKCGVGGVGLNGVDPWCFSAPGLNSEMSVASMAGAVASVQSAFAYLDNKDIFALLALTADGTYLGVNPATGKAWTDDAELVAYLETKYELPGEYIIETDAQYIAAFKEVFGYGLINLERATKPGTSVYFYDGEKIVSANGDAYWRAATNTAFRASSALNLRSATISAPFFDVLESADGKLSVPRIWENEFAFGATDSRGLYMGDVLGELKTVRDNSQTVKIGNLDFSMATSERAYDDYMGGLDNLSLKYNSGNWNFGASYQRYLTDGASRFSGLQNPIMGLASNAVVSDAEYNYGKLSFGGRVFSGAITDEGLLETDPTISSQYMPAKLGLMQGADSYIAFNGDKLSVKTSFGVANESDTLLGAYSDGLLDLGAGDTIYTDIETRYNLSDNIGFMARATFARTTSDASGNFILGLTDIDSNAFAFGANIGNLEFSVSQPLAITDGALKYAYAKYDVDENSVLNIVDTHVADLSLQADKRETRFMGTYRHKFGEFTDGAFGFIYRVNPNHTDKFGNESVFMLKMTHKLGI